MKGMKPKIYTEKRKLVCDWTDTKKYPIHRRMLKIHVKHGMLVDKVHERISFKDSKWLEKQTYKF